MQVRELLPDPRRVMVGLRDTGYQFETAIADVIDNSIAANATTIDININIDFAGDVEAHISDNGHGMNFDELMDAMTYGSQSKRSVISLGKFGLGLKTASTAFSRKLSVITKSKDSDRYVKATWDIDHVQSVGKWEVIISEPNNAEIDTIKKISEDGCGTLVEWQNIDRLLRDYADPGGRYAILALEKEISNLREHVAMVYQRFLDDIFVDVPKINIIINGESVEPWDPFAIGESELVAEQFQKVRVVEADTTSTFVVRAYVLPRRQDFIDKERGRIAKISSRNQGFYIYRENRLIYGPGWLRMYSIEPHMSLLRIEFAFSHVLDDAFHIDIKKSQILLNENLRKWLMDEFLPTIRKGAEQVYRKGRIKIQKEISEGLHGPSNEAINEKAAAISESQVQAVNPQSQSATILNKYGRSTIQISIDKPSRPGESRVRPVDSITDALLWEPIIIEKNNVAVAINSSHEYYSKVYIPNRSSSVLIQGLDSLFWALCQAEMETINEQNAKYFKEMRIAVSRLLRNLVEDLPDAREDEDVVEL